MAEKDFSGTALLTATGRATARWTTLVAGPGVVRHSFWIPGGSVSLPAWVHVPASAPVRGTVVVCPPMGFELTHSYRSLLHLADALASRGLATVRFDYFGTGAADGDAFSPDLLPRWLENIERAASFAHDSFGGGHCSLVGVQLGATLAAVASSRVTVEKLVLWAPVVQGKRFVRERRLLANVSEDVGGSNQEYLDAGGFILAPETARRLAALDLVDLDYSAIRSGVLIVEREDTATPPALLDTLEAQNVRFEVRSPGGFVEMMAEPQYARVPEEAIRVISEWLGDDDSRSSNQVAGGAVTEPAAIAVSSRRAQGATEELVLVPGEAPLFGILTEPVSPPSGSVSLIILANAGSVHQVGPNRTYVEITRALADRGVPSLRLDLRNLGDSITAFGPEENHPYPETATADLVAAARWAGTRGYPAVVLGGLCSGAHAAFRAGLAMDDPLPRGLLMINPLTFRWTPGMSLDTPDSRSLAGDTSYYRSAIGDLAKWRRLLTGRSDMGRLVEFVARRTWNAVWQRMGSGLGLLRRKQPAGLEGELEALAAKGVALDFVFSDSDPGRDILHLEARAAVRRLKAERVLTISTIKNADHTFSKLEVRSELTERVVGALVDRHARMPHTEPRVELGPGPPLEGRFRHEVVPYESDSWQRVAPTWRKLYRAAGETSPFLTTEWMSSWVESFGALLRPEIHLWLDPEGRPAGCVLLSCRAVRVGPFKVRQAYVNATGEGAVFSEHNDLLVLPQHRERITRELVSAVRARNVDQLALLGFRDASARLVEGAWPGTSGVEERWSEDPFVDLDDLRTRSSDYLSSLSSNTRSQIRRSIRLYSSEFGEPRLQVATNGAEAADWFSSLVRLHNERWQSRGLAGAFASPGLARFHASLIERAFDDAGDLRVDLLRFCFGTEPIGFLYNLRCGRYVASYQSGLRYEADNRLKPGLVIHAAAIEHYRATGASEYDFLAGEPEAVQYKRSLSTSTRRLFWGELSAPTLRMATIQGLRRVRRGVRPLLPWSRRLSRNPGTGADQPL